MATVNSKIKKLRQSDLWQDNSTTIATLGVLLLLMLVLTIMQPTFIRPKNLINVLLQASVTSVMAIGMTFIIISGGINLAVGSTMALTIVIGGDLVVNRGLPVFVVLPIMLVVGLLCGLVEGLLISKVNIAPFIVTLGTMSLWRGMALQYVDGQAIYGLPEGLIWLGSYKIGPQGGVQIPVAVICMLLLFILGWFLLNKTTFGMHVTAIGGNEKAATLSGINVSKTKFLIYIFSGLMCAVAGIITMGRMNGAIATVGVSYELDAIASVAIGGTAMSGGKGSIWGTFIGAMVLQVIRNGMNFLQVSPHYQKMVIGIVIIVAVGIDSIRRARKKN
jgi:ribose transport system permease protein